MKVIYILHILANKDSFFYFFLAICQLKTSRLALKINQFSDKVQYIQTHLCKLFVKISLKSKYIMLQFTVGLNNGKNSVQQLTNVCLFSKNGLSTFFTFQFYAIAYLCQSNGEFFLPSKIFIYKSVLTHIQYVLTRLFIGTFVWMQ